MSNAHMAAGIVAQFTRHGGCWKILDRRVRVESRLLRGKRMDMDIKQERKVIREKAAYPHCITTSVMKYTLCASWSRSEVSVAG